ncbi:MAG: YgjV family protein [Acidimicrobiia bacterium]|nr:YgjV family protein [Acidimicrobiia bacterium]MDH5421887.1 YgjV family protein [Acidimicrobiia bacterium]MDH5504808.1 YgjV family protein [Acidimicrobiia bacterium]
MSRDFVYELVGYLGSALVVTALLMTSLRRLRMVSFVGALVFTTYAILIGAVPLIVVNVSIMLINASSLYRMSRVKDYFSSLSTGPESVYLKRFLEFYREDIEHYFPSFTMPEADCRAIFVLRDLVPAGLWIGHEIGPDEWLVDLDYAIPRFRDSKIGRYLYSADGPLPAGTFVVQDPAPDHVDYLKRMGFAERSAGWFERSPSSVER